MNATNNDFAFYFSICVYRKLRDMGLISAEEYTRIAGISREKYGSELIVS